MIKSGSTVQINYKLTVDGEVVDASPTGEPLEYIQGAQQIIPGLEEQLEGLLVTDKKTVMVSPEKGYGLRDEAAVQVVPRSAFPQDADIVVGTMVAGEADGHPIQASIAAHDAETVTLDMNHPLAGKQLKFEIEVVSISE